MVRLVGISMILVSLLAACGAETPGRFGLTFKWEEKPEQPVWIWAEVRERSGPSLEGRVLAAAEPVEYPPSGGIAIAVDGVPHGKERVVVVEVREAEDENLRVLWYGFSEPFSLYPGDDLLVEVPLAFRAPEAGTRVADKPVSLLFGGETRDTVNAEEMQDATAVVRAAGAVAVVLANDASFSAGLRTVALADGDKVACSEEPDPDDADLIWSTCAISGWDLTAGLGDLEDGSYSVFAKLKDRFGYESAVFRDSVYLDTRGPVVLSASVSPPAVTAGAEVLLTVTLQEELAGGPDAALLRTEPAEGPTFAGPEQVPDTTTYTWRATARPEDDGGAFGFFVTLKDVLGNASEEARIEDQDGGPITFAVDATPPGLHDAHEVHLKRGGVPAGAEGLRLGIPRELGLAEDRVSFTFVLAEGGSPPDLPAEGCDHTCPTVRLGDLPVGDVARRADLDGEGLFGFEHSYDLDPADWGDVERELGVAIRWSDRAGNALEAWLEHSIELDLIRPGAIECALLPEPPVVLNASNTLIYTITASEPLREAPELLDKEGAGELEAAGAIPSNGERTWTWTRPATEISAASLELEATLRDLAGNASKSGVCAFDVSVDTVFPEIRVLAIETLPEVKDGEEALLLAGAGDMVRAHLEVVESAHHSDPPSVWLDTPGRLAFGSVALASDEGLTRTYVADLLLDEKAREGSEGVWTVSASVSDAAGNEARLDRALGGAAVGLDFTPPTAECFLNNDEAKSGDEVRVTVTFSEPIDPLSLAADTDLPLVRDDDASEPDAEQPRFVYTFEVPEGFDRSSWSFRASATDLVGNPGPEGASCEVSGIADGDPPLIAIHELWSGYADASAPEGWRETPGLARDGATIRVRFSTEEAPAPGTLKVWVDNEVLPESACEGDPATGGRSCSKTVDVKAPSWRHGPTAEPTLPVLIELEDDVGNRASMPAGNVRVDPNPPFLTGTPAFSRCDHDEHLPRAQTTLPVALENQGACGPDGRCKGYCYVAVEDDTGATVERQMSLYVDLSTSEPISAPSVHVEGGGDFLVDPSSYPDGAETSTFLRAYYRPDGSETQWDVWPEEHGPYSEVRLSARDEAGNELDVPLGGLLFDFEAPDSPTGELAQLAYRYERVPWGSDATGGKPRFSLTASRDAVLAAAGDGGRVEVLDAPDTVQAQVVTWAYVGEEGLRPLGQQEAALEDRLELGSTDRGQVFVQLVDAAGNRSDDDGDPENGLQATLVRNVSWTATTGATSAANARANPHRFETRSLFANRFEQADAHVPAKAYLLPRRETTITTEGAGAWRHHPGDATAPEPRQRFAGAYDSHRDRVLVFGGAGVKPEGRLWIFDGAHWSERTPADPELDGNPEERWDHGMVYDPRRDRLVLFGGAYLPGAGFDPVLPDDTWEWDGVSWRRVPVHDPEGDGNPPGREKPLMVWDEVHQQVLMIESPWDGDTWIYDGASWRLAFEGPWRRYITAGGTKDYLPEGFPAEREAFLPDTLPAWDPASASVVVVGQGVLGGGGGLYSWSGAGWDRIGPRPSGDVVELFTDRTAGRLMAGNTDTGIMLNPLRAYLLEWDGSSWEGASETVSGPTFPFHVGEGRGMQPWSWYVRAAGGLVVLHPDLMPGGFGLWDDSGWSERAVATTAAESYPRARLWPSLVDAPDVGGVLLFSGLQWSWAGEEVSGPGLSRNTWRWTGASWALHHVGPTHGDELVYFPFDGVASTSLSAEGGVFSHGGWVDDPDIISRSMITNVSRTFQDGAWAPVSAALGDGYDTPPARNDSRLAFDAAHEKVVLFGGYEEAPPAGYTEPYLWPPDTWLWDGVGWSTAAPSDPEVDGNPSGRYGHAMVYYPPTERVLLYGGAVRDLECAPSSEPVIADTCETHPPADDFWAWDGVSWDRLESTGDHPGAQVHHSMVWDEARQRVLLFGGAKSKQPTMDAEGLGEYDRTLYEWDGTAWSTVPIADPDGEGAPLAPATALAYDSLRDELVMPSAHGDGGTWVYDGGKAELPAHVFRVDLGRMEETSDYELLGIGLRWGARAFHRDNAAPPSDSSVAADVWVFTSNAFERAKGFERDQLLAGDVSWSTSDSRQIGRLLANPAGDLLFALTPASVNGTGRSRIETAYVEATVRFLLSR